MKYEYDSYNCILCSTSLNTHATTASALAAKQAKVNDAAPDSVQPNKLSNLLSLPFNWSAHHTTYWQHSDHLGSASWVSDKAGKGIQHLYYLPWGEELDNQRATDYASRYTFSGKERDMETGYGYFGARHYNSDLSLWLSVDPLSDKYPGVSPYAYCANNPVRLVDVDGREVWHPDGAGNLVADKGDNAYTLAKYLNVSQTTAINIFKANGHTINEKGILDLKIGDKINPHKRQFGVFGCGLGLSEIGLSYSGDKVGNMGGTFRFRNSKGQLDFKYYKNGWRGNQWVGTTPMLKIGQILNGVGHILGFVGIFEDAKRFLKAPTLTEKAEYALDLGIDIVGIAFAPISLYWNTIGKKLHYDYLDRVIIPMTQDGINMGLPGFQPFK